MLLCSLALTYAGVIELSGLFLLSQLSPVKPTTSLARTDGVYLEAGTVTARMTVGICLMKYHAVSHAWISTTYKQLFMVFRECSSHSTISCPVFIYLNPQILFIVPKAKLWEVIELKIYTADWMMVSSAGEIQNLKCDCIFYDCTRNTSTILQFLQQVSSLIDWQKNVLGSTHTEFDVCFFFCTAGKNLIDENEFYGPTSSSFCFSFTKVYKKSEILSTLWCCHSFSQHWKGVLAYRMPSD